MWEAPGPKDSKIFIRLAFAFWQSIQSNKFIEVSGHYVFQNQLNTKIYVDGCTNNYHGIVILKQMFFVISKPDRMQLESKYQVREKNLFS